MKSHFVKYFAKYMLNNSYLNCGYGMKVKNDHRS